MVRMQQTHTVNFTPQEYDQLAGRTIARLREQHPDGKTKFVFYHPEGGLCFPFLLTMPLLKYSKKL
jgi:hypothetical protein